VIDAQVTSVGTITGNKNDFSFTVQQNPGNIQVGAVYKIEETNKSASHEVRVKSIQNNTVYLETSDITQVGYQALPLQDTYFQRGFSRRSKATTLRPSSTWRQRPMASGPTAPASSTGLYTKVRPGSDQGSKKIEVYWNASLVETFDNLSNDADSDNWYETRINDISQYIYIKHVISRCSCNRITQRTLSDPWDTPTTPRTFVVADLHAGGRDQRGWRFWRIVRPGCQRRFGDGLGLHRNHSPDWTTLRPA
jgi:hypothetical protein